MKNVLFEYEKCTFNRRGRFCRKGETLEGADFAAKLHSSFIITVNDTRMSVAEKHGGLYSNLQALRVSDGQCECNLFLTMGLGCLYVAAGNNVTALIAAFRWVKGTDYAVAAHINTSKA